MGLAIESKTINREKRYMGFNVQKGRDGQNLANVTVATGYYDNFNGKQLWVTEFEEILNLSNDQLMALFSVKPSHLGLTSAQTNLFSMLDTALYAVVSGQLPIKFNLTVTAKEGTTPLTDYIVYVIRNGQVINSHYVPNDTPYTIEAGTVVGGSIKITKYGYQDFIQAYPILNGNVTLNAALIPVVVDATPTPEPEPTGN